MEERCRAIGVVYHASRCPEAAKAMVRKGRVAPALAAILQREGGHSAISEEHNALMAMTAIGLVNLGGDSGGRPAPHTLLLLLESATLGRPFGDVRWRVYDVLYPMERLTRDRAGHGDWLREGAVERVLGVVEDWFPGMYMAEFPAGGCVVRGTRTGRPRLPQFDVHPEYTQSTRRWPSPRPVLAPPAAQGAAGHAAMPALWKLAAALAVPRLAKAAGPGRVSGPGRCAHGPVPGRQWPEVSDLSHVFARCASQKTHGHARIARVF